MRSVFDSLGNLVYHSDGTPKKKRLFQKTDTEESKKYWDFVDEVTNEAVVKLDKLNLIKSKIKEVLYLLQKFQEPDYEDWDSYYKAKDILEEVNEI